jgi:carbonic anhydrase
MQHLIDGYRRFRAQEWPVRRAMFEHLAHGGQSPTTMVIACSDSRVDPTMIFNAEPGELFILRNVANLVPPYQPDTAFHATSAALEFAVRVLEVSNLIVMGHAMCGGIGVLLRGAPPGAGDFLLPWMRIAERAKRRALERASDDPQSDCEQESVKLSLENLLTFPWIEQRVAQQRLTLIGTLFDIRSGVLTQLQPDGRFAPVGA